MDPDDRFAAWSRRLQTGDRKAFAEVFQEMHVPLLRYAWRLTGDEQPARDLVQDAFVRLWTVRETLDPARSLKALLYTMVRNLAFNRGQEVRTRQDLLSRNGPEPSPEALPDQRLHLTMLGERVNAWIAEMPERRREAFVLSRFHELSHEEIARLMNLTPPTVNTHIMLALKHLRQRLRDHERDPSEP